MADEIGKQDASAKHRRKRSQVGRRKDVDDTVELVQRISFSIAVVLTAIAVIGSRSPSDGIGIDNIIGVVVGGVINGFILAFIVGGIVRLIKEK